MQTTIKRTYNVNRLVQIEALTGMVFQAESGGHLFEISGIDNAGEAVALPGTVSGVFLRPDNTDVALSGSVSGGVVSVPLKAECYAVPGRFGLTLYISAGGNKTAIYAAMGTVSRTSSGQVAPTVTADVVDLVNRIAAAVNSIPATYTDFQTDIAPTYSDTDTYKVGQFAWYNGDLKRCKTAITTPETYTDAHWENGVLGNDLNADVTDLKSALNNDIYTLGYNISSSDWNVNGYLANDKITDFNCSANEKMYVFVNADTEISGDVSFYLRYSGSSSVTYIGRIPAGVWNEVVPASDVTGISFYKASLDNTVFHVRVYRKKASGVVIDDITALDTKIDDVNTDLSAEISENVEDIYECNGLSPISKYEYTLRNYTYVGASETETEYSAKQGETLIVKISGDAITDNSAYNIYFKYSGESSYTPAISMKQNDEFELTNDVVSVYFYIINLNPNKTIKWSFQKKYYDYPDYYRSYLQPKATRINELSALSAASGDVFSFITDEHYEYSQLHSPVLLEYFRDKCKIQRVFNGGDTADGNGKYFDLLNKNYNGKIYSVTGNHEWFDNNTNDLYLWADVKNEEQIGNPIEHYYYVDNRQKKIRYIVLSSYLKDGDTFITGYNTEQLNWLNNDALNVPNGWDIILFSHDFSTSQEGCSTFRDALDTAKANGKRIICVFCGHFHYDAVWHTTGGIPIILTTCDKNKAWVQGETDREPWLTSQRITGTTTEHAFDVVIIDRENKTIKCVRIGGLAMDNVDKVYGDTGFTTTGTLEERTITYT